MHIEELISPWLRIEYLLKKKTVSMKSIHDIEDSFSNRSLQLSTDRSCLLPEMYVFTLVL